MTENSVYIGIVVVTLIILLLIASIIISVFVANRQRLRQEMKMSDLKLSYEKELRNAELELREQLMSHVSRELHDHVGHTLLNMQLIIENRKLDNPDRAEQLKPFEELLKDADKRKLMAEAGAVILLDGSHNWLGKVSYGLEVQVQVKADTNCVSVAAAAVLAKVTRDALMQELDQKHPGYGLAGHKGYASAAHIAAVRALGPSAIHRLTWLTRILA
jgi:ribonuclease HII